MIRFGLCCLFVEEPIKFRTVTAKTLSALSPKRRLDRVSQICLHNAESVLDALHIVDRLGIGAFRILSPFFPRYTHPEMGYTLDVLRDAKGITAALKRINTFRRSHNIRLSFHPDQFVVLNSPREDVVRKSIAEIEYQAVLAKALGAEVINDIAYEDVRLGVTQAEILHFSPNAPPGCSNFACWGKWIKDGRLIHGRNLDWNVRGDAQDDAVVLVWRPKGGTPFMMVGWAGGIGSVSGMSAKGITIGEMTLPSPNATFDGLPLFLTMRRVLEKSSTLDEAVGIIQKGPRTSGWNFILGDGKVPDGRALEVDAKRCEIYKPMDPKESGETMHSAMEDCVRRTNHPVGKDGLLDLALAFGPKYGVTVENWEQLKALLPMLQSQNSYQRYVWLGKEIQAKPKGIDIKEALELLANGPVFNNATLHSWVFDPRNQTAYVAVAGNNPPVTATRCPYTKIDLRRWFK